MFCHFTPLAYTRFLSLDFVLSHSGQFIIFNRSPYFDSILSTFPPICMFTFWYCVYHIFIWLLFWLEIMANASIINFIGIYGQLKMLAHEHARSAYRTRYGIFSYSNSTKRAACCWANKTSFLPQTNSIEPHISNALFSIL